jgi:hypothetical protein
LQALLFARGILCEDCECFATGTVRKPVRQVGIAHEHAFMDRLYDIQWVDFAHSRLLPLLMKGLILDSRNTVLLERPSPSSTLNSNRV